MGINQLRVLIQLALIDGELDASELRVVEEIAARQSLDTTSIQELISVEKGNTPVLDNLSNDDKFEYMYSLVELMKVDGRMQEKEIKYITFLATKLGYDEAVLFELVTKVHTNKSIEMDKEMLKRKIQSYLK